MKLIEKIRKNLIFRVICEFVSRFYMDGVSRAGASRAYFLLFSFFPLLIFGSLLVGTFHINVESAQELLKGVIPTDILNFALGYVSYVSGLSMEGLMYTGLGTALWTASRAINSLSVSVNRAYRIERGRNPIVQFLINIGFSAAMLISIVFTIAIVVLGRSALQKIGTLFDLSAYNIDAWHILRFVPITLLFFVILLAIYSIVPNTRIAFRQVLPGAASGAVSWLVASIGFSFYVENFARYSVFYGSIGAVIVLMVWLYLTGIILIMGAELNHVIYIMKQQKNREKLFDVTQPIPRFQEEERARSLTVGRHEKRKQNRQLHRQRKITGTKD